MPERSRLAHGRRVSERSTTRRRAFRKLVPVLVVCLLLGAVAAVTSSSVRPDPAGAAVYTPPASIDRTGTRDVTAELQTFLSQVPHHSRISFPPSSRYRIEGTLNIRRKNGIVVDGNGSLFFATEPTTSRIRMHWNFENISGLLVEDMVIRGAHPNGGTDDDAYVEALEAQHGINIAGGDDIEIRNTTITDVYGDFVYVGRSARPVFGTPTDVWIHHNTFRRNGRQGIAVTHGSKVVIEHNDIADTRRATIDLEPNGAGGRVRDIWIRDNTIGRGRLLFVAGHGGGDVSNIYIQRNVLNRKVIGIDMVAPLGTRRSNVVVSENTSDMAAGNPREVVTRFVRYDHVKVIDNVQPTGWNRDMRMVGSFDSCRVVARGNDLGEHGVGQLKVLVAEYDCSQVGPLVIPPPRPVFRGQSLALDTGGYGSGKLGVTGCRSAARCAPYLVGGTAARVLAPAVTNPVVDHRMERTMFVGDPRFEIPIRGGTYRVTLSFVEPSATTGPVRKFNVDVEQVRRLTAFRVFKAARGINRLVRQTFDVTTGDGTLDIDFFPGAYGSIVSLIQIERL
jgi:hypothetical protein